MAEHDTVWTAVSALLRAQVSEAVWLSTFQDVIALPSNDTMLHLQVPNGHVRERILTRYLQLVLDALAEIDESDRQLHVDVAPIDTEVDIDLPDIDFDAELARLTSGSPSPDAPSGVAMKTETRGQAT
ncbi:MAG: DnaA N-terminal domain-containing protein, partial [Actinomycetota bacterium]